ncbi:TIGR01841 family phasin, partial [Burkholderia pseudomallei]|uniref:TIGR01841 family phasin n=1 Tax=Burkholderia pseudomallei TaxID=28450 RepID=UPI0005C9BDA0
MLNFMPENLVALNKANAATLFTLTNQVFEGYEQLIQLNLQVVRQVRAESRSYWQEALSHKTPEEIIMRQTNLVQSSADKVLSYSGQLATIVSNANLGWMKAVESQYEYQARSIQHV